MAKGKDGKLLRPGDGQFDDTDKALKLLRQGYCGALLYDVSQLHGVRKLWAKGFH